MNTQMTISAANTIAVARESHITRLIQTIKNTLHHLGEGKLSPAAYDTAWVARIPDEKDPSKPMFPQCLQWLQDHQHSDGSWGSNLDPVHYYDKAICTLSVIVAFKIWQDKGMPLNSYIDKGTAYLNNSMQYLHKTRYRTVGFEILFPSLFQEALQLEIALMGNDIIDKMRGVKEEKLKKISFDAVFEKPTTLLCSLEGVPLHVIDWNKVIKLQNRDGSFLTSPSATAFVYLHTGNKPCLEYLRSILGKNNYVPTQYPVDVFEIAWCLEIISGLKLEPYFETAYDSKINVLKAYWSNTKGISWSGVSNIPDLDDTSVVYHLLNRHQLHPVATAFEHFYSDHHVFCFPGELDSSVSSLLHFFQAYNGNNTELVNTAKQQLIALLNEEWTDKWHLSPYYLTSIAVEALFDVDYFDVERMIDFILKNQHQNGSWGINGADPEETGWACMTLMRYISRCGSNKAGRIQPCLEKGIRFLAASATYTFANRWIAKCLYTVYNIGHTLINAVLLRYYIDIGDKILLQELNEWIRQHVSLDANRASAMFYFTKTLLGKEPVQIQKDFFKLCIWTFGLDDIYDADDLSLVQLQAITHFLLSDEPLMPQLQFSEEKLAIVNDLQQVINELMSAPVPGLSANRQFHQYFLENIRQTITAMLTESAEKTTATHPNIDTYLAIGRISVATSLIFTFTFYSMDKKLFVSGNYTVLDDLLNISGEIVRLINDKGTHQRDLREGKLNSISIIQRGIISPDSLTLALQQIDHMIAERMLQLRKIVSAYQDLSLKRYGDFAMLVCEVAQKFYAVRDFK